MRNTLIGVFLLVTKLAETDYSPDEQRTLNTLANQTAVAIENARLFSLEQQKLRDSSALLEVARAMSSTLDLNRMLRLIAQRTAEVCGFDRCSIFAAENGLGELNLLVSEFSTEGIQAQIEQSPGRVAGAEKLQANLLLARMMQERRPMIVDKEASIDLPPDWAEKRGVKGLLVVPLIAKDRVSGLMTLEHLAAERWITDDQVNLAATIASQVSVAIENAGLYQKTLSPKKNGPRPLWSRHLPA